MTLEAVCFCTMLCSKAGLKLFEQDVENEVAFEKGGDCFLTKKGGYRANGNFSYQGLVQHF